MAFVSYVFGANMAFAVSTGVLVEASNDSNVYPDGVYFDSSFGPDDHSMTSEAADSTADDVDIPASEVFIEYLYIGSHTVFDAVEFDISTAGSTSRFCIPSCHHYDFEYYNGETDSWASLDYTDNTNNFETAGEATWEFEVPDAWDTDGTKTTVNGQTLFWVRVSLNTNTSVTTTPEAAEIGLRAYNLELTVEDELGNPIEGMVSEDFTINGGTDNGLENFREMGDGVYQMALNGGLTDSNYNVVSAENGFVDRATSTGSLATIKEEVTASMTYSHKVRVTNEDGTLITPDTAVVNAVIPPEEVTCEISGSSAYCPLTTIEDGTSTTSLATITLTKSGYEDLTVELSDERDDGGDAQVLTTVEMVESEEPTTTGYFTLSVENEDGDELTTLTESDFTVSGGTVNTVVDFTNNGDGTYTFELATGTADANYDIEIDESGYDSETVATGTLTTATTTTGSVVLEFSTSSSTTGYLEVTVTNEDADELTNLVRSNFTVTGGTDNRIYGFTNNNDGSYILELATGNADNNYSVAVTKDGYVSDDLTTDEIGTGTTERAISLDFAYKITVTDEDGNDLSGASVKAGDLATTCQYMGSGEYGCAVPLGESDYGYRVSLSGYITENGSFFSDRTSHSDAQMTANVELELNEEACEVPFEDTYGHWAEGYIEELYCREVVQGRDSDSYVPNDNVTRAEFLKIALLNAGYEVDGEAGEDFSDVSSGDWFYEYVSFGADQGFIEGYEDGTFRPNDPINRAEAVVITMRIAGEEEYEVDEDWEEFEDVDADAWYAYAIQLAADAGIVEGYDNGEFRPGNNITRAEVAAVAVRTYDEYYED